MHIPFADPTIVLLFKLSLAVVLGVLMGTERVAAGNKGAGMRTFAIVTLGACLFVLTSQIVTLQYLGISSFDPMHMAAAIVTGIGFLGAGLIIMRDDHLRGLTTAAALWTAAAVGVAVGFGLYAIAIFSTILVLFIFTGLWFFEEWLRKRLENWDSRNEK